MKKKIIFRIACMLIVGFIIIQMLFISIFDANLVIDIETSLNETLDSITIECYLDNKLVIDTIAYSFFIIFPDTFKRNYIHIILPLQVKTKNHSLFFLINDNKSKVIKFNSCLFTFIEVLYSENEFYNKHDEDEYFKIIKIKKDHFKYFWRL